MQISFISVLAPAIVALIPAAVVWWHGRRLARRVDDPALPERLFSGRHLNGFAIGFSFVVLVVTWPWSALWSLPLLFLGRLVAAYPARRVLLQETWTPGAYLSFFLRLSAAMFAYWVLLSSAPALINAAGRLDFAAAAVVTMLLVAWNARYPDVIRRLLRAKPIDDDVLHSRFARLIELSGIPMPRFEHVQMNGGVFANAAALPSLRQSAVVFTDTLLSRLDADELTAICAHEIAHLEHYNRGRLRSLALVGYALIAGVALTPVFGMLMPSARTAWASVWPAVVLVTLVARARNRQQHETESDLRAVELTGDPEALVRGLTKLHAIARMPRRWDAQFERQATHPSLVRRIKAIREAAGTPGAVLGGEAAFNAADGTASVVFRDDVVEWNEGGATKHSIGYSHITELRLDAKGTKSPRLIAVDRSGRAWQLPIMDVDVARIQAVMDVVDVRTAAPAVPALSPTLARVIAFVMAAMLATIGQFASVVVALLAVLRPGGPLLVSAGVAALASAGLLIRDHVWRRGDAEVPSLIIVVLMLAAAMLWLARVNRADTRSGRMWTVVAVLGVCAALAWTAVFRNGLDIVRLHQAARAWPAAAVFSIALAAASAVMNTRRARAGAAAAAVVGLFAVAAGSTTFLEAFSRDAFVAPADSFVARSIAPRRIGEFRVPFDAESMQLSPHGRSVAIAIENEDEETVFHVGPAGGRLTAFEVDEVGFIDDDRVLLLEQSPSGATLKEVAIGSTSTVVGERHVEGLVASSLFVDPHTASWTLVGRNRENQIVRAIGNTMTSAMLQQRWEVPGSLGRRANPISASDRGALVLETRYQRDPLAATPLSQWSFFHTGWQTESHVWTIGAEGSSTDASTRLDLHCVQTPAIELTLACAAFDGARTRVFILPAGSEHPMVIGWLDGRFHLQESAVEDYVTGWWNNGAALLRLSTREALRINSAGFVRSIAVAGSALATIESGDDQSIIRVYTR